MSKTLKWWTVLLTAVLLACLSPVQASQAAAGKMTKYRVYQSDRALKEFSNEAQAVAYAKYFAYSHVETIPDRKWVWNNFPKYKVYQNGSSNAKWEFRTYEQALALAKSMRDAHIRNLDSIGWTYGTYAKFRLYQGDDTKPEWSFQTLDEAKKEAKKWSNAHIVDLNSNEWIWDNLTDAQRLAQKKAEPVYRLTVNGEPAEGAAAHSFLKLAIMASNQWPGSEVVNTKTGKVVHSNVPQYEVVQNGKAVRTFVGLHAAIQHAKTLYLAEVKRGDTTLWSGIPYWQVYQNGRSLKAFNQLANAIDYAKGFAGSSVRNADGRNVWSNESSFMILGWNGSSAASTIMSHVGNTQGLDIDSPTWFELTSADGTLRDSSDPAVVQMLKDRGILTMPLVHNGFNRQLTTQFLADKEARQLFISSLVNRLSDIGAYGVNLDFEEVAGADRAAYTAFVKELTAAAHAQKLKVSIDLPRGSVSWNHLTAYDHAALADIVDTIIIMAYDEHWRGSDKPGSVAGLAWTEEGVKQFLDYGIPRSKLMLGIPFYVREWRLDSGGAMVDNRALLMKDLPKLIQETGAQGQFDPVSGQTKYTYVKDGYTHVFWAETEQTVLARIAIAKKYDLAGVAAWRLGYEDGELWTKILRAK